MVGIKPITQHQQPHSNAQTQHQEPQDLLTNPVLPQAGRQPSWPVTTSTSPAAASMLTANAPSADGRNTGAPALGTVAGSSSGVIGGGWNNSRPNSTSIHTPSPTSAPMGGTQPTGQPLLTTTGGPRLPPPLAPTTTHQPLPSSQPPPAYTPPHQQHLSSTGFQTSPHSSSWRYVCTYYRKRAKLSFGGILDPIVVDWWIPNILLNSQSVVQAKY